MERAISCLNFEEPDPVLDHVLEELGTGGSHMAPLVRFAKILQKSGRGGGAIDVLAAYTRGDNFKMLEKNCSREKHIQSNCGMLWCTNTSQY